MSEILKFDQIFKILKLYFYELNTIIIMYSKHVGIAAGTYKGSKTVKTGKKCQLSLCEDTLSISIIHLTVNYTL